VAPRWSPDVSAGDWLAARNGRIAHAEMQLHLISVAPGSDPEQDKPLRGVSVGSLPPEELTVLASLLARHTTTPGRAWFAVWEGYAQLEGAPDARIELPNRGYRLLAGAVSDAVDLFPVLGHQSPNLWWPDDRAWCVATEIDFAGPTWPAPGRPWPTCSTTPSWRPCPAR
jgi:hypothetical protein